MISDDDPIQELLRRLQATASPEATIQLLLDAADAHPADARPLLLLAAEFMEQGEVDRAEAAYSGALLRAPGFSIARFQLGLLQFSSGRPVMAMVTWGPLDQLDERDPLRLFKQGFERLAQDDFEDAGRLLREGIAVNSANLPLNRDMEMVLERMALQRQAIADESDRPAEPAESHFLVSAYQSGR